MQKTGIMKLKLLSIQPLKGGSHPCTIKIAAKSTNLTIRQDNKQTHIHQAYILPITNKMQLEVHNNHQDFGFFEVPLTKILSHPGKRHLITVSCITKDANEHTLNPEIFTILKLSLRYLANHIAKLNVFIDKVMMDEQHHEIFERQLFVEYRMGDLCSQTQSQKVKEGLTYVLGEQLSFTLEEIPSKIELLIKDKDFVDDEVMGCLMIDPQREGFWSAKNNMEQRSFEITNEKRKIVVYLRKYFEIQSN